MKDAIERLERDLKEGNDLPEELWFFFSRWTPIVNVDLIIKNELNQHLLTWRDDQHGNCGWHVPGGVVRYKETWATRITAVAKQELGIESIQFHPVPITVNQVFVPPKTRGHFISIPFNCFISSDTILTNGKWFDKCPENIVDCQEMYRQLLQ